MVLSVYARQVAHIQRDGYDGLDRYDITTHFGLILDFCDLYAHAPQSHYERASLSRVSRRKILMAKHD
jgi:hypothetical protein